jgi:hypothetical protein
MSVEFGFCKYITGKLIIYDRPRTSDRMIKSRKMRIPGHSLENSQMNKKILVGKSEGKRPLRRHRRRWEIYVKINIM